MTLTFELLHGVALSKEKGAIPLTDEPVILSFFSRSYVRDNLFVTGEINGISLSFELVDGVAKLPLALRQAGALKLTVRKIINGEVLQVWSAEEILFREIEGEYEAIPQVLALTEKVAALTEAVAELKKIIIEREEF